MAWGPRLVLFGILIKTSSETLAPAATVTGNLRVPFRSWLARSVLIDTDVIVAGYVLWFVKLLTSWMVCPGEDEPANPRSYTSGAGCAVQQLGLLPTVMVVVPDRVTAGFQPVIDCETAGSVAVTFNVYVPGDADADEATINVYR